MFDGKTYVAQFDERRLDSQLEAVRKLMEDGKWRTLSVIHRTLGLGTEASISARLRDLRKPKFGGYTVERRRVGNLFAGLFEYRVVSPTPVPTEEGFREAA